MKVVITGVSRGIGNALLRKFLSEGHTVVGTTRHINENLKAFCDENLHLYESDLSSPEECKRFYEFVKEKLGKVNVLIHNAGLLINAAFVDMHSEDLDKMYQVNFKIPYISTQTLLALIPKNEYNHVVLISSRGGVQGSQKFPGLSGYSAMKGAVSILAECISEEFPWLSCNAYALGAVKTEMLEEAFPNYSVDVTPEQMADFIYQSSLNQGGVVSGQVFSFSKTNP